MRNGLTNAVRSATVLASLLGLVSGKTSTGLSKKESNATYPINYGFVLIDAHDPTDIFGPTDILQLVAHNYPLNIYLIADTMEPHSSAPLAPGMNPYNSSAWPKLLPTHTFDNPPDLDVLIVPGGPGVRAANLSAATDFIINTYPKLQYLLTVCTGAGLAARSGVLDGKQATTNKKAWSQMVAFGPNVKWTAPARWVVDGNIWSSSGVTAGIDMTFQFIKEKYPTGQALFDLIWPMMEYVPHTDQHWDPFATMFNVSAPYHLQD